MLKTMFNLWKSSLMIQNVEKLYPSDAKKIIRKDIYSVDLATAYFVLCSNYSFRSSIITTQRLYELAARGICVVVGVKSLPREYELISQVFYPDDLR